MVDEVEPVTRLRIADAASGCRNLTLPPAPTEKLFQSMMALVEFWLTVSALPDAAPITAWPDTTVPPRGSTVWAWPAAGNASVMPASVTDLTANRVRRRAAAGMIFFSRHIRRPPIR